MTEDRAVSRALRRRVRVVGIGLACTVAACDEESRDPLPDWSAGFPDASVSIDGGDAGAPVPDAFGLVLPATVTWPARLGRRDAMDQPCAVTPSDTQKTVDCMLEVPELDLWTLGVKYDIVVPDETCDFVLHVPYIFANFPYGTGPAQVAYTVNADGTFSNEVNAAGGKPSCVYDHSRADKELPNCCLGTYTLEVTSAMTGAVTRSTESWGGKLGDCFYGAGYVENGAQFDPSGLPKSRYIFVDGAAYRYAAEFPGVSDKYPANIPLANYYDPRDHGGTAPAPLLAAGAQPYYEAYCVDDAEEMRAHIRLTVREWNEEAQFHDAGSPETTGIEPGWDAGSIRIDDIADWAVVAPNNTSFPRIKMVRASSQ